jgi:uncharacterized membrane protein YhaH (DUF805 family)
MAEAWERVYAKFYWLIIIVVAATMFWLVLSDAIRQGSLHTVLTTALKSILYLAALFVFGRIIATRTYKWRTRRRLNAFLFYLLSYGIGFSSCYILFGRPKGTQVFELGVSLLVMSLLATFLSSADESTRLPPPQ